jgi:hypothetical protein
MHKIYFLSIVFISALSACNNNSSNKQASADSMTTAAAGDTGMSHAAMDSMNMVAALPPIPSGAKVFFSNLKNGQTVKSPFKVIMGATHIKVDSAGAIVAGEGHHHLLIDAGDSVAAGVVVPKDAQHLHFGNGQTETTVTLPPGKHRLTLQFADGIHRSYGSALAASIEVNVK